MLNGIYVLLGVMLLSAGAVPMLNRVFAELNRHVDEARASAREAARP
jgi:hypothetical protein